jgi:hypothetical protein
LAIAGVNSFDDSPYREERPHVEGAIEAHRHQADFLPGGHQSIYRLSGGTGARPHQHDDSLRLGVAGVVEQPVPAPDQLLEPIHQPLDDPGDGVVVRIRCFACLEEDVGVLGAPPQHGTLGLQRTGPMRRDGAGVDKGQQVVIGEPLDLGDLVRGTEPIEEVQERDPRVERCGMGDRGEVLSLLDRRRRQHGKPGHARRHHIAVVAENGEGVRRHGPRGDVNDPWRQFACDLEHVRQHQQQALRRGEGAGQRPALERAVDGPGSAGLALHLDDGGDRAPQIRSAGVRPRVGQLTHGARRGDRIYGDHFAQSMSDMCRRLIAVDRDDRSRHCAPLPNRVTPASRLVATTGRAGRVSRG